MEAYSLIRSVTAARPAISVNDSRQWSQNSVSPPKPLSLIMDRAKSNPCSSAFCTTALLSSKVGMYCGELLEMSQPLLPMGMKTPMSMPLLMIGDCPVRRHGTRPVFRQLPVKYG
ncbi:hypothetical protein QFZ22_003140 [Streptomyces canus]|uniref:Uncharacterized protein n=1 Tax=Streptomyces canus TaxID=58343 RepID=A0AAW8FCR4_9ACTN|nr:hypothetical protein [Streptomyces canus]